MRHTSELSSFFSLKFFGMAYKSKHEKNWKYKQKENNEDHDSIFTFFLLR